jgi:hypothetical protein
MVDGGGIFEDRVFLTAMVLLDKDMMEILRSER